MICCQVVKDFLIKSAFFLHAANTYSCPWLIAFVKKPFLGCLGDGPGKGDCLRELYILLVLIFVVRLGSSLYALVKPIAVHWGRKFLLPHDATPNIYSIDYEYSLESYSSTCEGYSKMVVQVRQIWRRTITCLIFGSLDCSPCLWLLSQWRPFLLSLKALSKFDLMHISYALECVEQNLK